MFHRWHVRVASRPAGPRHSLAGTTTTGTGERFSSLCGTAPRSAPMIGPSPCAADDDASSRRALGQLERARAGRNSGRVLDLALPPPLRAPLDASARRLLPSSRSASWCAFHSSPRAARAGGRLRDDEPVAERAARARSRYRARHRRQSDPSYPTIRSATQIVLRRDPDLAGRDTRVAPSRRPLRGSTLV